jgi:muramoyltetrapeptide carboxypeptidase LdcA involved in peptidoglycan recycling
MLRKPLTLSKNLKIGIFTPSSPAHVTFPERFDLGLNYLRNAGYDIVLGKVTALFTDQGYRTADPISRADELNELFADKSIGLIISTIGGANCSSLIPYLDYSLIAKSNAIFCGYSDVTSLHMAITTCSNLSTLYGPAVVPSFGEFPSPIPETANHFWQIVSSRFTGPLPIPARYSNKSGSWATNEWKTQSRQWHVNEGLRVLKPGSSRGESLVANLNTLLSLAGTKYFPDLKGKILFLEEMLCPLSRYERNLRHLQLLGGFDNLAGVIISKPEKFDRQGAPFTAEDLLIEIIGADVPYPVLANFDCGHTHPLIAVPNGCTVQMSSHEGENPTIELVEPFAL